MQNFTRFTPAHQPGDVFVRTDAVTSVAEIDYSNSFLATPPTSARKATVIGTGGNGLVYVKESPSQVIEALRAAGDTHLVTVEYVMEDGDTSSLADDCACNCGVTCCDDEPDAADYALALKEAQDDAKIADERAEWYNRVAEERLREVNRIGGENVALRSQRENFIRDNGALRMERDQLLAKLKETTAALDKANAELAAIPRALVAQHDAFISAIKAKLDKPGLYGYTKN